MYSKTKAHREEVLCSYEQVLADFKAEDGKVNIMCSVQLNNNEIRTRMEYFDQGHPLVDGLPT